MDRVTVVTPVGCIGNRGVEKEALEKAIRDAKPDALAMDAGSLDCGPWYLGAGSAHSPQVNIRWDLDVILGAAVPAGIPVIIGSAGGSGARTHVEQTVEVIREVARKRSLRFKMAVVYSDVPKDFLLERAENGLVRGSTGLDDGSPLETKDVEACSVIVGAMGVEPIIDALGAGADVVLCGRAVDAAVIAAYPIWRGFDRGLAYHMGDIMECAELVADEIAPTLKGLTHNRIPIIGVMERDSFSLRPAVDTMACTPRSCLMHSFYERVDINRIKVPGGTIDKSDTHYEQTDPNTTRIRGARHIDEPYSILFEGVRRAGQRALCVFGVRNPRMVERLDTILAECGQVEHRIFDEWGDFQIHWHRFGKDAVLKDLETEQPGHEVGVIADIVAETAGLAKDIGYDLRNRIAFWRYDGRQTTAGNIAVTFSPSVIDAGEVYEMSIYHALAIDDYRQIFETRMIEL